MAVPDYYNRFNPDLLPLMPRDAQLVVEVGCGAGALAEQYKRTNPGARYVGIELNPEAAHLAQGRLEQIIIGNVEQMDLDAVGIADGSVDCLVYGDVLEHMIDPWAVLRRHAAWLRPGGSVAACIPNVQNWSMILNLLRGRWFYQDEGLLDRTHLRFFTAETIPPLFAQAGLQIAEMHARVFHREEPQQLAQLLGPAIQALNLDASRLLLQLAAFQYVVRAVKPVPQAGGG